MNVETLVVADRKMLEKHSKENVTTYILTVMNMVRKDSAADESFYTVHEALNLHLL